MSREKPKSSQCINVGEEDELSIEGFKSSKIGFLIFTILLVLSGGVLLLVIAWKPSFKTRIAKRRCSLDQANTVFLKDRFGEEYIENVEIPTHGVNIPGNCVYFYHKKIKYIWKSEFNQFVKLRGLETHKCGVLYSMIEGLSATEAVLRSQLYGLNSVTIEVKPIWKLIIEEISLHVYQTRRQSTALRKKVDSESEITVIRDEMPIKKMSKELVPGDIITLSTHSQSFTMESDAVLMSGSCTLDESMLTGESVPISKVSLTDDYNSLFSMTTHKNNILFSGTQILNIQSMDCNYVKAIVIRTGFSTMKGELVRSILFPKAANFKLKYDLIKCMAIFFALGIPCMAYTAYRFNYLGAFLKDVIIIVVDVATFLVPPLLPAVLTSINAHAQRRLRKNGLYCLNSNIISCCGGLDVMCFDKTGTLTEDSIDFSGLVPVLNNSFSEAVRDLSTLKVDNKLVLTLGACHSLTLYEGKVDGENLDLKIFQLTNWMFFNEDIITEEMGFEKTPERIVGPKDVTNDINNGLMFYAIFKQFPFESVLQRMLVIVRPSFQQTNIVLVKGAPEVILSLCKPSSIPPDYSSVLESYTRDGLRVLAAASKQIESNLETVMKLSRDQLESELNFEGFMVFQNKLKKETIPVLNVLKKANIRSVMITGDNLLTSISVGRECGLFEESDSVIKVDAELIQSPNQNQVLKVNYNYAKLPGFSEKLNMKRNGGLDEVMPFIKHDNRYHLALEGNTFNLIRQNDQKLLNQVVHKGTIFSRMSPQQKLDLIKVLQQQGHQVGMCGDGANDCGALRTANAGISLSMAESSVASPFTYRNKDISCVPLLIREGRATLSATIGAFKYQVCYCFVLLATVLILFWEGNKPSDGAYVFVDIILNLLPPLVFGTTEAYPLIVRQMPTRTVLSFLPQFSMYSFVSFQILMYLLIRRITSSQKWFEWFEFNKYQVHKCDSSHISFAIFSVNMVSYVISAIIFSPGPPYRKNIFSNRLYLLVVLINLGLVSCVLLFPPQIVLNFLNFKDIPFDFKLILFTISIANFIFSYIWEVVILQGFVFNSVLPKIRALRGAIHPFELIEEELDSNDSWPPIQSNNSPQYITSDTTLVKRTQNKNDSKQRNQTNVWIMRSISTDDELEPYCPTIVNKSIDSPIELHSTPRLSFSTFGGKRQSQTNRLDSSF